MGVVKKSLPKVTIPTLVIQSSHDPVVNPDSADEIFEKISSKRKELIKINASRHGIINGEGSGHVFRRILQFLDENFGKTGD